MSETRDPEKPDIVFHYNRERRLENAPESVRKAHEQGIPQRPGIIRGLTATPGLRSIFFVIVLLSVIITALTLFGTPQGYAQAGSVPVRLRAFLFDEQIYVTLTLNESPAESPLPVHAVIRGMTGEGMIMEIREIDGVYTGKKLVLRTVFPDHGIFSVEAELITENSATTTSVSVDRK